MSKSYFHSFNPKESGFLSNEGFLTYKTCGKSIQDNSKYTIM